MNWEDFKRRAPEKVKFLAEKKFNSNEITEIDEWLMKLEAMDAWSLKRLQRHLLDHPEAVEHPVRRLPELAAALKSMLEGVTNG